MSFDSKAAGLYSVIGFILGASAFLGTLYILQPIENALLIGIAFVPMILIVLIFIKISNRSLWSHINSSSNPRREFWNAFLKGNLPESDLDKIPPFTNFIESFNDSYTICDRYTKKKIRLIINDVGIRFQNVFGKFTTYKFKDILDFTLESRIPETSDSGVPIIELSIRLKNGEKDSCDLCKIDYPIDELEQILDYFKEEYLKN